MSQLLSPLLAQISWLKHGFGTLMTPAPTDWPNWDHRPQKKQIHSAVVTRANALGEKLVDCDAVWSDAKDVPISVISADCVPILIASQKQKLIGAAHSGWRGTQADILSELVRALLAHSPDSAGTLVAAVGPHIRACCYEVSPELARDFSNQFGSAVIKGESQLDLTACVSLQLQALGIEQVDFVGGCTRCTPGPQFHSFRREGGNTRQWSSLMIIDR
jgi:YfiH family protein